MYFAITYFDYHTKIFVSEVICKTLSINLLLQSLSIDTRFFVTGYINIAPESMSMCDMSITSNPLHLIFDTEWISSCTFSQKSTKLFSKKIHNCILWFWLPTCCTVHHVSENNFISCIMYVGLFPVCSKINCYKQRGQEVGRFQCGCNVSVSQFSV